jgi:hypothetical protein
VEDRISELEGKHKLKKKRRNFNQTTQELWKEYGRTYLIHQKTKPENHEYWWRKRGLNQKDT